MTPDFQTVRWMQLAALASCEAQKPLGTNTELNFEKFPDKHNKTENLLVIWASSAFWSFIEFDALNKIQESKPGFWASFGIRGISWQVLNWFNEYESEDI